MRVRFNAEFLPLKKNQALNSLIVFYVSGYQRQHLDERSRRNECVRLFEGRISPPKIGIGSGNPAIQRNDPIPSKCKQNNLAFALLQTRLGRVAAQNCVWCPRNSVWTTTTGRTFPGSVPMRGLRPAM